MNKRLIFISYSHEDETWKDLLEKQLGGLLQQGKGEIEVWTDDKIGAGEDWYQEIEDALQNAWVAILLISDNSLTSDFILKEEVASLLKRRVAENLQIVPIIVRDCPWKLYDWLKRMQVRPRGGRALEKMRKSSVRTELMNIVIEIAEIDKITNPAGSESRVEGQDRAIPKTLPKATGVEAQKSVQELKAERERIVREATKLRDLDRQISELEGGSGYRESSARHEGVSQQTTKAQVPEGEVNAKKDE